MTTVFNRWAAGLALATLLASVPAQAQFGGFGLNLGGKKPADQTSGGCPSGKKKSVGASILGSVAGSVAGRAAGRFGTFLPIPEVASTLTNAIACKLDEKEQKQAAEATLAATRGDEATGEVAVGATSEWTSATRPDVKGKSTVIAANEGPGKGMPKDAKCITVTDVIIVNGEETTANKRMCRAPGQARYALMA
ncbi:MAG TPA: hypothetical protein VM055_04245 [Novosphingobium sp.]|nr:hypothetical protein [Novosphingobium sp.]